MSHQRARLGKIVGRGARYNGDADDGHALVDGGLELEQAPRPGEHRPGLQQQQALRISYVLCQLGEVVEVVAVEEGAAVELGLQLLLQPPGLSSGLHLVVREEGVEAGVVVARPALSHFRDGAACCPRLGGDALRALRTAHG